MAERSPAHLQSHSSDVAEITQKPARDICNALLEHATKDDDHLRQIGEEN